MTDDELTPALQSLSTRVRIRDFCKDAAKQGVTLDLTGVEFISRAAAHELVRQIDSCGIEVEMSDHVQEMTEVVSTG